MGRNRKSGNLWGYVLIALGIVIAGNVLGWWKVSVFFKGWWALFIIIPCAQGVRRKGFHSGSGLGLIFGIMMLMSSWKVFSIGGFIRLLAPLCLIYLGIKYVLPELFDHRKKNAGNEYDAFGPEAEEYGKYDAETDTFVKSGHRGNENNCTVIFSGEDRKIDGEEYFGSDVTAIFGGASLDLRGAMVVEDVEIHANAIFGGIEIYVPQDVNVKVKATSLFGGTDNNVKRAFVPEWPTIYIYATSLFGGTDIK